MPGAAFNRGQERALPGGDLNGEKQLEACSPSQLGLFHYPEEREGPWTRKGARRPGPSSGENLTLLPAPLRSSTHSAEGSVKAPEFRLFLASVLGLGLELLPSAQGSR